MKKNGTFRFIDIYYTATSRDFQINRTSKIVAFVCVCMFLSNIRRTIFSCQVLIHDAVRPFIEESLLKKIVVAAKKHGVSDKPMMF